MNFDLSHFGKVYEYIQNNTHVFLDIIFLGYSLYTIITYYNLGITNALLRLIGYIASFFISRILTTKIASYFKIVEPMNIVLLALFLFFLFAYLIYKQLQFFGSKSRSWLDSLLGGLYGVSEIILLLSIINTCANYANKYGFPVPDWMVNQSNQSSSQSITVGVMRLINQYTAVAIKEQNVAQVSSWLQAQLNITEPVNLNPKTK